MHKNSRVAVFLNVGQENCFKPSLLVSN